MISFILRYLGFFSLFTLNKIKTGAIKTGAKFSINGRCWPHLIQGLGTSSTSTPPPPPPSAERTHQPPPTSTHPPTPLRPYQPPSFSPTTPARERAPPSVRPPRRAYNIDGVGKMRKDSLGILNLNGDVTEREVKTNYWKIAQK